MWYYIGENINGTFVIQKEITKEEFQTWKESVEQLKYYTLANRFKDITIKNGLELEKYLKRIASISDIESIRNANTSIIGTESNRLMLNYLVSFRTFVDNLQAYSKSIKKGADFQKNILNYIYDTEPIYPFLYKLRNFATHFSMVFDCISIEYRKVNLQCSKEHLLEYNEWNKKSRDFINTCDEFLPIAEYVEHNNVLIMSIYLGFLNYFADDIQEIHNKLMNLMKQYQVINPLFFECESADKLEGAKVSGLALSDLKNATSELSKMPNINIDYVGPEQILNNN